MTRTALASWSLVAVASAAGLWTTGHRALRAHDAYRRADSDLAFVAQEASEIAALASASQSRPARPAAGLAPRITATLTKSGLPASCLASFNPDAQATPVGDAGLKRWRAGLTLAALTLPQFGSFLDAWRTSEPTWMFASIDLSPSGAAAATPGGDLPLRAVLTIEAIFADEVEPATPALTRTGDR